VAPAKLSRSSATVIADELPSLKTQVGPSGACDLAVTAAPAMPDISAWDTSAHGLAMACGIGTRPWMSAGEATCVSGESTKLWTGVGRACCVGTRGAD
jgi:hypothetical protein